MTQVRGILRHKFSRNNSFSKLKKKKKKKHDTVSKNKTNENNLTYTIVRNMPIVHFTKFTTKFYTKMFEVNLSAFIYRLFHE